MLGRKRLQHLGHFHQYRHHRTSVYTAARHVACEALEARQLLTQFPFNVPQNEGYTAVYLRAGQEQGWVDVRKNSATGTVVHTFKGDSDNGTGMYIVDAGSISAFLFVDQVAAARKPTATQAAPNEAQSIPVGAGRRISSRRSKPNFS
jgi:hypothetical protein